METPPLPICATVKKPRWHLAKHKVVSCWEGQNYPKWQLPITEKLGHLSNKQTSLCLSCPCSQTHCLNGSCLLCTKIRKVHECEVCSWAESQNPCKGLYWRENTAGCEAAGVGFQSLFCQWFPVWPCPWPTLSRAPFPYLWREGAEMRWGRGQLRGSSPTFSNSNGAYFSFCSKIKP